MGSKLKGGEGLREGLFDVVLLGLCQELGWIELMILLLLLVLVVGLGGNNVRVQSIVGFVFDDVFGIRRVHVPGLVSLVRIEGRIRSHVDLSLHFLIELDLLVLGFVRLLLVGVLGWVLVNGPGAVDGFLVAHVLLGVSDVLVQWQSGFVFHDLFFFVLGVLELFSAPASRGANWIGFGSIWSLLIRFVLNDLVLIIFLSI